jgi:ATP-binding cassette, subfamily B, bacterial MsbA
MIFRQLGNKLFARFFSDSDFRVFVSIFREYFPAYKYRYGLIFLLIGVASVATAAAAWLVRDVVNGLFLTKQGSMLIPIFLLVLLAFLLKGLSTYWQSLLSAHIANDMVAKTQERMISHILMQRAEFFDRFSSDDLIMRISMGAGSFGAILNRVVLAGARDLATVLSLAFVMVRQDLILTLICLIAVPPIFLCISLLLKRIKSLMQQEMQSIAELNKHVREAVQGFKVIKSYNLEPVIKNEVDSVIESIKDRSNKVSALENAPVPIIDTLGGVAVGLTILYAGYRTIYGTYDPGTFMSFITAMLLAMDPARRVSQLRVTLRTSLVGVGMVHAMLEDDAPEIEAPTRRGPGDAVPALPRPQEGLGIVMEDVAFAYSPGANVLDAFTLNVKPGDMVALIGPSGAGKSTVFSLLLRFHRHQAGRILVGGRDIEHTPVTEIRDLIAYVGQANFIFSGSIRDNLTLRRSGVSDDAVFAACKTVGLHDHIMKLPRGYDTFVGELGSLISGGQAQRLNIARAIIKDAPILLFDEVTSALDAENEELVRDYMHAQAGRKTIIVIAHRLSTIRQADRIALVQDGRVEAFGTHHDLIRGNDYYGKVAGLQLIA